MPRRAYPRLKDGDALEPHHLNVIFAELERWNRGRGAGGIVFRNLSEGPLWLGGADALRIVKTSESIPARSGLVLGHGTARWYTLDVASWTLADSGNDLDCGNWSGGSIAIGKFAIVAKICGAWLFVAVEC